MTASFMTPGYEAASASAQSRRQIAAMLQTSRQYRWRKDMPAVDATRLPAIAAVSDPARERRRSRRPPVHGLRSLWREECSCRISGSNTLPGEDAMRAMHVSAAAAIVVACAWASLSAQAQ